MSNYPQQQGQQQKRKKTFLNDYRQAHPATDAPINGGKYPAQLMWEQKVTGQIVMKINDGVFEKGAKTPHKEVEMDAYDRGQLFEAILEAANDKEFQTRKLTPAKHQFVFTGGQGRMSENPVVQCNLTVSRDANGEITVGYSKGDYKALIRFKGPRAMTVMTRNAQGESVPDNGVMSRWAARHYVSFVKPVLERMELDGWEPPKPRNPDGQQNNRNSYNDNDSSADNSFDDDF